MNINFFGVRHPTLATRVGCFCQVQFRNTAVAPRRRWAGLVFPMNPGLAAPLPITSKCVTNLRLFFSNYSF